MMEVHIVEVIDDGGPLRYSTENNLVNDIEFDFRFILLARGKVRG